MSTRRRKGNESITLFVQGHGVQNSEPLEGLNDDASVRLLSFSGFATCLGQMKICDDKKPVDIVAVETIQAAYAKRTRAAYPDQNSVYKNVGPLLIEKYKSCGLTYPDKGFKQTWPRYERTFSMAINEGECTDFCPEYGISVVASSDPADAAYTLATQTDRDKSNMSYNANCAEWWKQKAILHMQQSDYTQASIDIVPFLHGRIFTNKTILLSELILYFKMMGFHHIFILDPSCRYNNEMAEKDIALIFEQESKYFVQSRKSMNKQTERYINGLKLIADPDSTNITLRRGNRPSSLSLSPPPSPLSPFHPTSPLSSPRIHQNITVRRPRNHRGYVPSPPSSPSLSHSSPPSSHSSHSSPLHPNITVRRRNRGIPSPSSYSPSSPFKKKTSAVPRANKYK